MTPTQAYVRLDALLRLPAWLRCAAWWDQTGTLLLHPEQRILTIVNWDARCQELGRAYRVDPE